MAYIPNTASIIAQASSKAEVQTCKNNAAAHILYLRQARWEDWSQLLIAIETTHPITSMHIIDKYTCKKSKLCSTGSLTVFGDASGRLSVISPSTGVQFEISSGSGPKSIAGVTALTSFASERNSIVIVAGYSDGSLRWHALYEEEHQLGMGNNEELPSLSGFILSETSSAWTVLDAFALHGGKHGVANIAGATADGQVAWGRIYVGTKKQKFKLYGDKNELHWDNLLIATRDSTTSNHTTTSTTSKDGIIAAKAHLKAAEFVTYGGEIIWSPFLVKKKNQQERPHVLRPPRPCDNWDKYSPTVESNTMSEAVRDTIGFTAVAMEAVSSPTSRIFSVVGGNSELVSMRTGTASGKPTCHVIARKGLESIAQNSDKTMIEMLATLPGYVLAVTASGELQVYNTSGAFHRPSFSTVLQQPLQDLVAELAKKVSNSNTIRGSTFWPSSMSWWKYKNPSVFKTGLTRNEYRIAAGLSTQFSTIHSTSSSYSTNGLTAIQFSPTLVALYATSLPYRPPRGTAGNPGSSTRIGWLAALQPILVAGVVGYAMHKAKVGKRQAAAQQYFRSKMMERAAAGGGLGFNSSGGGITSSHFEGEDWDIPFPWEERLNGRSGRRGAGTSTGAGEQRSRDYRRRFNIDTGLGGRRATTKNTVGTFSAGDRTKIRNGGASTRWNEEGFRPTRPTIPAPHPLVDRAPLPGITSDGAGGVAAVLGDIGSEYSDSQCGEGENIH